ncbi:right-handed parallel beta-helix repeat-containing protein [Haloarchaeobius sp. HME9146]|uniref:right-handed parallel beta-helix repeat-containing protein n=1 Tax=Haloarchaeobius sp. HME9146 TaxID=2978732 RepID=UPI0021C1AEE5|nr:right-handed parallel beta-helix repeat-containing protein [Haloarchaeobius sp. HME9146]MCT9095224.1 right-handed parallel beta-helix repeat-containing protein [Haloarchaeobius sp. HME9146]
MGSKGNRRESAVDRTAGTRRPAVGRRALLQGMAVGVLSAGVGGASTTVAVASADETLEWDGRPVVLSEPNTTYQLVSDFYGTITIEANGITLDGADFVIEPTEETGQPGDGVAVRPMQRAPTDGPPDEEESSDEIEPLGEDESPAESDSPGEAGPSDENGPPGEGSVRGDEAVIGVSIENLVVKNAQTGIRAFNAPALRLKNVDVEGARGGVNVSSASWDVADSDRSVPAETVLEQVRVRRSQWDGFVVARTPVRFRSCLADRCGGPARASGFRLQDNGMVSISRCLAQNCNEYGFHLTSETPTDASVRMAAALGNGTSGIHSHAVDDLELYCCYAGENAIDGIAVVEVDRLSMLDCTASENDGTGIAVVTTDAGTGIYAGVVAEGNGEQLRLPAAFEERPRGDFAHEGCVPSTMKDRLLDWAAQKRERTEPVEPPASPPGNGGSV